MKTRASTPLSESIGFEIPNETAFKDHAKKLKEALEGRGITLKLSDTQEALAKMYGYNNAQVYKAATSKAEGRILCLKDKAELDEMDTFFYFAEGYLNGYDAPDLEYLVHVKPGEPGLSDYSESQLEDLFEARGAVVNPDALSSSVWQEIVVSETLATGPHFDRYGIPHYGDNSSIGQRILAEFHMRVFEGIQSTAIDRGDDGCGFTIFELKVPKAQAEIIRAEMGL